MIIKKIQIENFLCYYNEKSFHFEDGLNIILGENNEGKTKFFEAIEWLFNGTNTQLENLVSSKKFKEITFEESFKVSVSMVVENTNGEYKISRSFLVNKTKNNDIETRGLNFEGQETDLATGRRIPINGQELLNAIFPFQIREYSMFKGETELNIFENEEALPNLINLFSDAKPYQKYTDKSRFLRERAHQAVKESTEANQKNQRAYNILESEIFDLEREKERLNIFLSSTEDQKSKLEKNIKEAEKFVDNAEALSTINELIKKIEEKITYLNSKIDDNYTTSLFDEYWILQNFEPIHKEFVAKISEHSKRRRELQSQFDQQIGIRKGEEKAKAELINNIIPLPIGTPSKAHMEEMLHDEICKVCNREAKVGSEAYSYMMQRLTEYLETQKINDSELDTKETLFKFDYTNRLENLSISHEDNLKNIRLIETKIKDLFEFNDKKKKEIESLKEELEKQIKERERILGNSKIANEDKLLSIFKNYTSWQEDLKDLNKDFYDLEAKQKEILKKIESKKEDINKIDENSAVAHLLKTREILNDIENIFTDTKEKKFDEFITKLENKSNKYFGQINVEAFTGEIKFSKKRIGSDKVKIEISLYESGGRYFVPGTAVRTSLNISILLAISELANEENNETYPMIFDAPTSSFGETKTGNFLNLIYKTSNQKIILLKDFVATNKDNNTLFIKSEFNSINRKKAFWVKLERPFDDKDLSTMNTEVITL